MYVSQGSFRDVRDGGHGVRGYAKKFLCFITPRSFCFMTIHSFFFITCKITIIFEIFKLKYWIKLELQHLKFYVLPAWIPSWKKWVGRFDRS